MRDSRVCRFAQLAVDATDVAEREVNPLVGGPDGVVAVDAEHARNRRGAMGIRKSVGKNKKSNRPTEAASVERGSARRKADNARTAPKPKRGSR